MRKYLFIAILVCLGVIFVLGNALKSKNTEIHRLDSNQSALMNDIEVYKTKTGELVYKVETLTLTNAELRRYRAALVKQVESMGLKIKRLESITSVNSSTADTVKVKVRDTLYLNMPAKTFLYNDPWTSISGIIYKDTAEVSYKTSDSLLIVKGVTYKKFIFRSPIWGVKSIDVNVTNSNPHNKISSIEQIDLERRR